MIAAVSWVPPAFNNEQPRKLVSVIDGTRAEVQIGGQVGRGYLPDNLQSLNRRHIQCTENTHGRHVVVNRYQVLEDTNKITKHRDSLDFGRSQDACSNPTTDSLKSLLHGNKSCEKECVTRKYLC
jgi:hypothetical protein